ncbi:PREDICTED: uncharacterized protein LOC109587725 [Amphimedon queenslandica]|nr:PREDICTED: uncharacterized protein LOC109587725 [Amphimedon queenslandica]|eukprot:XP_019859506.1 PREDICTED: uncharacterized protein LOC109587725 [Amphimedon queenslandica]
MVPVDNIVELSEVFLIRISATSAHVKITGVTTQQLIVDSEDVFRIGIKDINISVMEGGTLVLTIQQIGDERGGEAIGGLPENKIQPIVLRHEGGNATRGGLQSDFSFNPTVPKLTYSVNNTLNDITFTPITSIDDNIIEGNETIRVIIVPGGGSNDPNDHNVQVELQWQTATITIIDNDYGVLSLERGTYDVIENEGSVEICAVLTGGVLSTDTVITLQTEDNTAVWNSDYSTREMHSILKAFGSRTCGRFNIMNDAVKEELYQNFKVEIVNVNPQNSAVAIDKNQSIIRIRDDD